MTHPMISCFAQSQRLTTFTDIADEYLKQGSRAMATASPLMSSITIPTCPWCLPPSAALKLCFSDTVIDRIIKLLSNTLRSHSPFGDIYLH